LSFSWEGGVASFLYVSQSTLPSFPPSLPPPPLPPCPLPLQEIPTHQAKGDRTGQEAHPQKPTGKAGIHSPSSCTARVHATTAHRPCAHRCLSFSLYMMSYPLLPSLSLFIHPAQTSSVASPRPLSLTRHSRKHKARAFAAPPQASVPPYTRACGKTQKEQKGRGDRNHAHAPAAPSPCQSSTKSLISVSPTTAVTTPLPISISTSISVPLTSCGWRRGAWPSGGTR
jgi:hypothetical protein